MFLCVFFPSYFIAFFLHSRVQHIQMLIANINVTMIIFNRCYMIDKIWLAVVVVVVRFYANLDILILWWNGFTIRQPKIILHLNRSFYSVVCVCNIMYIFILLFSMNKKSTGNRCERKNLWNDLWLWCWFWIKYIVVKQI